MIACNSGGPLETITSETGYLCEPNPKAFALAFIELIRNPEKARRMGEAGRARVQQTFSLDSFAASLEPLAQRVAAQPRNSLPFYTFYVAQFLLLLAFILYPILF